VYALTGKSVISGVMKLDNNITTVPVVETKPDITNKTQPEKTKIDLRFGCASPEKTGVAKLFLSASFSSLFTNPPTLQ